MAYTTNPRVLRDRKRKAKEDAQPVKLSKNSHQCEKCEAVVTSISEGCIKCAENISEAEFVAQFGSTRGPQKDGLRIGMLNAQSLLRKMDFITALIHSHQFDIFVVVETWLEDADVDADVTISDYKKIRFDRPGNNYNKRGGGIIIYHRECFSVEEKPEKGTVFQDRSRYYPMQYIHVKVTHPWEFHLFAIYNPKKEQRKKALEYMKTVYNSWKRDNIVMLGDLNVEPMEGIICLGAKQIIEDPTLVTGTNSRIIDHIYTNIQLEGGRGGIGGGDEASSSRIVESGLIRSAISDHDVVFCTVKLPEDAILPRKCFAPDKDINNLFKKTISTETSSDERSSDETSSDKTSSDETSSDETSSDGTSSDITHPSKCSTPVIDITNLFDETSRNTSITELMQQIHEKAKNMGPIHKSYSTTASPSDIMAEGIRELERLKIEAMKSKTSALKWKDISKARKHYMPVASEERYMKVFAECSEFLTSSSILSWSKETRVKSTGTIAIEWVIRYWANKVGRFHKVEELVKEWTSRLNALIKGYKIFFWPNPTPPSTSGQYVTSESTSINESDTQPPIEEEEEEESSVESIIYGVFDYLNAVRTKDEDDIVKSRAETLKELNIFLKQETGYNTFILAYFCKGSDTDFKPVLNDDVDNRKFDEYWSKRKSRVEIKESPLFQRYLAVKRAELKKNVPDYCKMFASADEIAFCMPFTGWVRKEIRTKDLEKMKKKLKSMTEFKHEVLSASAYGENIDMRFISKAGAQTMYKDNITGNLNTITEICGPVDRETVVTFLGAKIDPKGIASTKNKETLNKLRRLESVNASFASEESSIIESVRLFTKGKV